MSNSFFDIASFLETWPSCCPGMHCMSIHSNVNGLCYEGSYAKAPGNGASDLRRVNCMVATSLAVLRYGSTGNATRIIQESLSVANLVELVERPLSIRVNGHSNSLGQAEMSPCELLED